MKYQIIKKTMLLSFIVFAACSEICPMDQEGNTSEKYLKMISQTLGTSHDQEFKIRFLKEIASVPGVFDGENSVNRSVARYCFIKEILSLSSDDLDKIIITKAGEKWVDTLFGRSVFLGWILHNKTTYDLQGLFCLKKEDYVDFYKQTSLIMDKEDLADGTITQEDCDKDVEEFMQMLKEEGKGAFYLHLVHLVAPSRELKKEHLKKNSGNQFIM